MPRAQPKNPLTRAQKLFRMESIYPLDANNIDVEEAISRLFVYLRKPRQNSRYAFGLISRPYRIIRHSVELQTSSFSYEKPHPAAMRL